MKTNHSLMRAALVLAAAAGLSQAAFADGLQKLGFIDTERVYRESKQAQNIEKTLQKEFAARQSNLQKLHREGESLEKSLAANKLSETERQEALQKLDALGRQFRTEQAQLAEDFNLRRNEEFAALQQNANEVIVSLAKREGYDLIIQEAVYVNSKFDITNEVIKSLNK